MLYFIIGSIASNVVIPLFPMLFGAPAIALTALMIAIRDLLEKEIDYEDEVFPSSTASVLLYLFIAVVVIDTSLITLAIFLD